MKTTLLSDCLGLGCPTGNSSLLQGHGGGGAGALVQRALGVRGHMAAEAELALNLLVCVS
jgi:hypothetical protein